MTEDKPCIACAEEIKSSAKLCKHCNTRQDDKAFEDSDSKQNKEDFDPVTYWTQGNSKVQGDSTNKSGFIFAAALVVAVAAAGVYFSNGQSFDFTSPSSDSGSSDTESQSQPTTFAPYESYYNLTARDGRELMEFSLEALNYWDPMGGWVEDPYDSGSPLVAGVLLDTYSVSPAGCAIWFFDSFDDLQSATLEGSINYFSNSWWNWEDKSGAAFLAIANSYEDDCFQNIEDVLEVEAYP